jgi:hypothetical protein
MQCKQDVKSDRGIRGLFEWVAWFDEKVRNEESKCAGVVCAVLEWYVRAQQRFPPYSVLYVPSVDLASTEL